MLNVLTEKWKASFRIWFTNSKRSKPSNTKTMCTQTKRIVRLTSNIQFWAPIHDVQDLYFCFVINTASESRSYCANKSLVYHILQNALS